MSVRIKWVILDIVYRIEVFNGDISEKGYVSVMKERCKFFRPDPLESGNFHSNASNKTIQFSARIKTAATPLKDRLYVI